MTGSTFTSRPRSGDTTRPSAGRTGVVIRGVVTTVGALLALGAVSGGYRWYRDGSARAVALALENETQHLRRHPAYAKRLADDGVAPENVHAYLSDLARTGTHRLDDSLLVRLAMLTGTIVDAAPTTECAAIARRPVLTQVVASAHALTSVDSATAVEYLSLQFRGAAAELQQSPARQPSDSAVVDAMTALMASLDTVARPRLTQALANMTGAADADACWAARTTYEKLRSIAEPRRSVLARAILADP
ncbi:MAG: hypothetical protein NVS1B4_09110 [Gemmatimonadaceae bacterium]